MILCDVNVLVYAFREDLDQHARIHSWLATRLASDEPVGVADLTLSGFIRIVTNPRAFKKPSSTSDAFRFATTLRQAPTVVPVAPGARHWEIFERLCGESGVKGNLVPDAYFAAMAIESGCEWVTTDGDYARFPGLRWSNPLRAPAAGSG